MWCDASTCKHLEKSAPGKSALLLCAGVRCESWYVSCVDFRWAATGSLAALIFVGFFKLRGLSQTPLRGCRFGGHRADDNGFQIDLSTLCLYGSRSKPAFRFGGVLIFDDALLAKHAVYTLSSSDLPVKISKNTKIQHSSHETLIFNPPGCLKLSSSHRHSAMDSLST